MAAAASLPSSRWPRLAPQERREIASQLFLSRPMWRAQLGQYVMLLVLSVVMATAGLLASSTAVVIAAMLVAPLMTPILAVAAGIVMAMPGRQLQQLAVVVASAVLAIGLGATLPWLFGVPRDLTLPPEVLARTQPGLADLLVALSAGFAGAFTVVRRSAAAALPGVAIGVSLVPPLSACGILLRFGESGFAGQAFLLFLTNFAVIVLTACAVFLAFGFRARIGALATELRIAAGVALATVLVVAAAVPLSLHTIDRFRQTRERLVAAEAVQAWAAVAVVEIVSVEIQDDLVELALVLDVPLAAAATADHFGELVPAGLNLQHLRALLVERVGREVEVAVRGQIRLAATTAGQGTAP